jgi:cbb3-type cytochrome oxidase maturation protein
LNALWITIPVSLLLAAFFVVAYIIAVKRDQFDDLVTPAYRILVDDEPAPGGSERKEISDGEDRSRT